MRSLEQQGNGPAPRPGRGPQEASPRQPAPPVSEVGPPTIAGQPGQLDEVAGNRERLKSKLQSSRRIHMLPHLITLGNAGCGLLAISKGIDALALSRNNPDVFFLKMETAAWLIVLAMVFDALDGKVARWTKSASEYGGQLDSFADFLTFGCAPALLAKVLIEHEGPAVGYHGFPRLHFLVAASFTMMALLRLVRFNVENDTDESAHNEFQGLPSPAAAGTVVATMLLYLSLRQPSLEEVEGTPTPLGGALAFFSETFPSLHAALPGVILPSLQVLLVFLGGLMVSRVRYVHTFSFLTRMRGPFTSLVYAVFLAFALVLAPVPVLFVAFTGYVFWGFFKDLWRSRNDLFGESKSSQ